METLQPSCVLLYIILMIRLDTVLQLHAKILRFAPSFVGV